MFSKKIIFVFSHLFIVWILLMSLVTNNRSIHITHNMQSNIKTVWFFEFMNLQVVCIVVALQLLLRMMFYCYCVRSFTRLHQSGNPRTYFHNHSNTVIHVWKCRLLRHRWSKRMTKIHFYCPCPVIKSVFDCFIEESTEMLRRTLSEISSLNSSGRIMS